MFPACKTSTFPNIKGQPVAILQPLVQKGQRPYYGWDTSVYIRGSRVEVKGGTPAEVFGKLRSLLNINNIQASDNQIWTTLNFAWLPRTPKAARLVDADAFFSGCRMPDGGDFSGKVPITSWFPPVLDSLGYSLAVEGDSYNPSQFRAAVEFFATMTDPASAFRLGDHRLAVTFLERTSELSYKPAHLLSDARDWFLTTYNSVAEIAGLSKLNKDTVKLKYNW